MITKYEDTVIYFRLVFSTRIESYHTLKGANLELQYIITNSFYVNLRCVNTVHWNETPL
jgi:hypothetical protein